VTVRPARPSPHLYDNQMHEFGLADFAVDTTSGVDAALADAVIAAWTARTSVGALFTSLEADPAP